jgi:hypothetical protein
MLIISNCDVSLSEDPTPTFCLAASQSSAFAFFPRGIRRYTGSFSSLWVRSASGVMVGFGILAYALFFLAGGVALIPLLRDKSFELFKSLHLLAIPASLLVIAHAPVAAAPYVLVPVIIGLLDWAYRWHRALRYAAAATLEILPGDMVRITLKRPAIPDGLRRPFPPAKAGEFFFVCFPGLNAYQWHPLSAAGLAAHEEKVSSVGECFVSKYTDIFPHGRCWIRSKMYVLVQVCGSGKK